MRSGQLWPLELHIEDGDIHVQQALRRGFGRRFRQLAAEKRFGIDPLILGLINVHDINEHLVIGGIELIKARSPAGGLQCMAGYGDFQ